MAKLGRFHGIINQDGPLDWEYDGDADALYISFGKPKPALGVDVGEGVIVRYDEKAREVVGLNSSGSKNAWKSTLGRTRKDWRSLQI